MSIPAESDAERKAANQSIGELFSEVSNDLSLLMRQEVELAKVEIQDSARRAGKGVGMLSGAGLAGYFALFFLTVAVCWGLAQFIGLGWSALVVAVIYAIVAAVLAFSGKKQLESVKGAPQTIETAKQIPEALKPEERP